jgi:hypothetical protein
LLKTAARRPSFRFVWLVVAGRGHFSEQGSFTEDLAGAKAT